MREEIQAVQGFEENTSDSEPDIFSQDEDQEDIGIEEVEEEDLDSSWDFDPVEDGIPDLKDSFVRSCLYSGESGDAMLYKAINRHRFRRSLESGQWYAYIGPHWEHDLRDRSLHEAINSVIDAYERFLQKQRENL